MLYAAVKACPVFGGTVKSYDFNAIKDRPGVHSAVKIRRQGPRKMPTMVRAAGIQVAAVAVVADTWWRAKTALDLMPIEWDVGPNGNRNTDEMFQADFETMKQPGTIVLEEGGSYAAAKSKAAKVVEATYTVPYLAHARMEPGNATAMVTPGSRRRVDRGPVAPVRRCCGPPTRPASRRTRSSFTPPSWAADMAAAAAPTRCARPWPWPRP